MSGFVGVDMIPWVVAIGAALIVIVLGVGLGTQKTGPGARDIEKRLKRSGDANPAERGTGARSVLRDTSTSRLNLFLRRTLPNPEKFKGRLERTGKNISIAEYSLYTLAVILGISLLLRFWFGLDVAVCLSAGLLIGLVIPNLVVRIMGNRRNKKFMKDFAGAIDMIVRGLKAGLPFIESVNAVGKEFPDPIGIEFRRVADSVKLGLSVEQAMWDVARRIDVPEFKFMIVAMTIQRETGGNLAETLGNLSDLLRKRRALYLKIRALSSEARASAYIIGALPFVMLFLLRIVSPDYVSKLWTDKNRGIPWSITGLCIMFTGYYVMYRMVNFEV